VTAHHLRTPGSECSENCSDSTIAGELHCLGDFFLEHLKEPSRKIERQDGLRTGLFIYATLATAIYSFTAYNHYADCATSTVQDRRAGHAWLGWSD